MSADVCRVQLFCRARCLFPCRFRGTVNLRQRDMLDPIGNPLQLSGEVYAASAALAPVDGVASSSLGAGEIGVAGGVLVDVVVVVG
jgi:hypothetical protein